MHRGFAVVRAVVLLIPIAILLTLILWLAGDLSMKIGIGFFLALCTVGLVHEVRTIVEGTREERVWYEGYTTSPGDDGDSIVVLDVVTADGTRRQYTDGNLTPFSWTGLQPGWVIIRVGTKTGSLCDIRQAEGGPGERPVPLEQERVYVSRTGVRIGNLVVLPVALVMGLSFASPLVFVPMVDGPLPLKLFMLAFSSPFVAAGGWLLWLSFSIVRGFYSDLVSGPLELTGVLVKCQEMGWLVNPADKGAWLKLTLRAGDQETVVQADRRFPWAEYVGQTLHVRAMAGSGQVLSVSVV